MVSINKCDLYPQELIMKIQLDRQKGPLSEQKLVLEELKTIESSLVNKILVISSFNSSENDHTDWEFTNFSAAEGKPCDIKDNWTPAILQSFSHGLQIRSLILKSRPTISLQSIACEMKISLRLTGESTFWVMTRGVGVKDPDSVVIKIKKESESQRVFLIFGANIGSNNEFRFFKRQEIPEIGDSSEDWIIQDFVELKLVIIDNGDDRVFVTAMANKRTITMSCDKFIPTFRDTCIFIAGSGDSVLVKTFSARQIERVQSDYVQTSHHECCNIF